MSSNVNINLVHALLTRKNDLKNAFKSLKEMYTKEADSTKRKEYKDKAIIIKNTYLELEKDIIEYIKLCDSLCTIASPDGKKATIDKITALEVNLMKKYRIDPESINKKDAKKEESKKEEKTEKETFKEKINALKDQAKKIKEKNKKFRKNVRRRVNNISDGIGGITCKVLSVGLAILAINSIACIVDNNKDADNAVVKVVGSAIYSTSSLASSLGSVCFYKFGDFRLKRRKANTTNNTKKLIK